MEKEENHSKKTHRFFSFGTSINLRLYNEYYKFTSEKRKDKNIKELFL